MSVTKVINKYLTDINWLTPSFCPFNIDNNIDVWKIGISSNIALIDSFLSILNPDEIARANRYYQLKDRNRFIISRGALRYILGKYLNQSPSAVEFRIGENKKPFIKTVQSSNLQYNLSHSGDAILLAISDLAVGTDIEFVNQGFGFKDILEDNFSADEIKHIEETESVDRFFRIWTRKEAITKATAQGLDCDLSLLPGLDGIHSVQAGIIISDADWLIRSFNINDQYAASIASSPFIDKILFWDLEIISDLSIFQFNHNDELKSS